MNLPAPAKTTVRPNPAYRGVQDVPAEFYEADIVLLDRYQGFSAEIVRISLLGIAVLGFFLEKLVSKAPSVGSLTGLIIRGSLATGVVLFAAAACAGLLHRYYSADGIFYHLRAVRDFLIAERNETDRVLDSASKSKRRYRRSGQWLLAAGVLLAVGGVAIGLAIGMLTFTIAS